MALHCKEFDVSGQKIVMGHDRETGKRYLMGAPFEAVTTIRATKFTDDENYIYLIGEDGNTIAMYIDIQNYDSILAGLRSIFWIE